MYHKLNYGDSVWIISPSNYIPSNLYPNLEKGIENIKELGLNVEVWNHIKDKYYYSAAEPENKIKDINNFLKNNKIKALISTHWGNTANNILEHLDFSLIYKNPKIFMGFSDITVLLNAIYHKTWIITYLGPDIIWQFWSNYWNFTQKIFNDFFVNQKDNIDLSYWFKILKTFSSEFSGKLLWGNIRCFMKLFWTNYFPDINNSILLIEAAKQRPDWFDSIFEQMKQSWIFDKINGIILWYNYKCFDDNEEMNRNIEDILLEKTRFNDINIIKTSMFWHNTFHSIFPIWQKVKINLSNKSIKL